MLADQKLDASNSARSNSHSSSEQAGVVCCNCREKIRIITTAWGSDILLIPQKIFLFRYFVKQTIKRSNVITADSVDMIEAMQKIVPNQKYKLLQYGIDPISAVAKEKIIYSNRLHESLYQIDKIVQYFADFFYAVDNT